MNDSSQRPDSSSPLRLPGGYRRDQVRGFVDEIMMRLSPVCESEGYELVHAEFQPESGGRVLRLYIDKPGGVTVEDCAGFSRQVGDLLDVMIDSQSTYRLEVSSPGIERPLSKLGDFERFKGEPVKIRTFEPINGQKNFTGILMGVTGAQIRIRAADRSVNIPHENIARARLASEG